MIQLSKPCPYEVKHEGMARIKAKCLGCGFDFGNSIFDDFIKGKPMKAYEREVTLLSINALAADITAWAVEKGFWNRIEDFPSFMYKAQKISLMHSELSELLEEIRKPGPVDVEGFTNEEIEVADLIIRALDYAGQYKLRIGAAIGAKMAKNEGRPFMHGKAF